MLYQRTSLARSLHWSQRSVASLLLAANVSRTGSGVGTVVPQATLSRAASSSALPLAAELASAYHAAFPHITVDLLPRANEPAAVQAVLAGRAEAALVAGPAPMADGLQASHVATDALAIVVQRNRALTDLPLGRAREIWSGRLRTWDELGAGEGVIQVVTREPEAGTRVALTEPLLGQRQLTPTAIVLPDDRQILERLANDPNAMAALPAGWLDERVKAVTLDGRGPDWVARQWPGYPLDLPIYLLLPDAPSPDTAALRDFVLSPRGQQIVGRRYAPALTQP